MNQQFIKLSAAVLFLITVQFSNLAAQTSPEIERLTAEIAKNPTFDSLYAERGILYTWNGKFLGPNVTNFNDTIDENRAKALADADAALKINPNNYKAYYIRGIVADTKTNFQKAAKLKSEASVIGQIVDNDNKPLAIVIKGDIQKYTGFDTLARAREIAKETDNGDVIIFDKVQKKFFVYAGFIGESSPIAIKLAETPFRKALIDKAPFPFDYESLKINFERHLVFLKDEFDSYNTFNEITDVVDADGFSLIRKQARPIPRGSKGVRLLLDSELSLSNFDEALKIYQWLDKINANSNDLDVVKINRKTNLAKMFRASDKLKPFVEKEMERWKYTEEEKTAVRGTK